MNSGLNSYFKQVVSGNEDPDPYRRFMDSNRVLEHLDSLTVVGEKLCDRHPGERLLLHELFRKRLQSARLQARPWFSRISERKAWSLYGRSRRPRCSSPTKSIIRRAIGGAHAQVAGFRDIRLRNRNVHGGSDQRDLQLPFGRQRYGALDAKGTIVSGSHQNQIGTTFAYLDELDQEKPYSIVPMKGRSADGTPGHSVCRMAPGADRTRMRSSISTRFLTRCSGFRCASF